MVEYADTGVNKYAIGNPTNEERVKLIAEGYTHMSNGEYADTHERYEIWLK